MYLSGSILPRGKTCVPWSSYIPLWEPNTSAQKSLWPWIPPISQEPPVEQRVVPLLSCFFSRGFPKDYDIPQHIGCYNPRTNHPPTGVDHCSVVESQTFTGQNLWNVCHLYQGSDQDSKMTHILRVYLLTYTLHKPYGRYLRFKYLKWPVIMYIIYIHMRHIWRWVKLKYLQSLQFPAELLTPSHIYMSCKIKCWQCNKVEAIHTLGDTGHAVLPMLGAAQHARWVRRTLASLTMAFVCAGVLFGADLTFT